MKTGKDDVKLHYTFKRKDKNIIILSDPNISKITLPQLARRLNNTS